MKKLVIQMGILVIICLLNACSDSLDVKIPEAKNDLVTAVRDKHIGLEEALNIAERVIPSKESEETRSLNTLPVVSCVMNNRMTRSAAIASDTVAYVINYPDSGGFVIVAAQKNVYPVLAFSKSGNFDLENEAVRMSFIDKITDYMEQADTDGEFEVQNGQFDGCYDITPGFQTALSQDAPWNKYVHRDHPFCKVGCVALASAQVMANTRPILNLHGEIYYLRSIMKAISDYHNSLLESMPKKIVGVNPPQPTYTYAEAEDLMAKFLYRIGDDVQMKYGVDVSEAFSSTAFDMFKNLGFTISSGFSLVAFNIEDVTRFLRDGHIIYLRGRQTLSRTGHAWISDGCYFCVDYSNRDKIIETYIHCDWGFGGVGNGYYSGAVFNCNGNNYYPEEYFAVKIEK